MEGECSHGEVELLGEQKGERSVNRYYRCLKCGSVLGGNSVPSAKGRAKNIKYNMNKQLISYRDLKFVV